MMLRLRDSSYLGVLVGGGGDLLHNHRGNAAHTYMNLVIYKVHICVTRFSSTMMLSCGSMCFKGFY